MAHSWRSDAAQHGKKGCRIDKAERGWVGIRPKKAREFLRDFRDDEPEEPTEEEDPSLSEGGTSERLETPPDGAPVSLVTYNEFSVSSKENLRVEKDIKTSKMPETSDKRHPSVTSEVEL